MKKHAAILVLFLVVMFVSTGCDRSPKEQSMIYDDYLGEDVEILLKSHGPNDELNIHTLMSLDSVRRSQFVVSGNLISSESDALVVQSDEGWHVVVYKDNIVALLFRKE